MGLKNSKNYTVSSLFTITIELLYILDNINMCSYFTADLNSYMLSIIYRSSIVIVDL